MNDRVIIGIDCATDPRKVGLARGVSDSTGLTVTDVTSGGPGMVDMIAEWIGDAEALIALDAPLGWPCTLGVALAEHQAGAPLAPAAHFNRESDRLVHRIVGKKPLDVGSDRIARTARAALILLDQLRDRLGCAIPLAWTPNDRGVVAIEVYPAATLHAHGLPSHAYKKKEQITQRDLILSGVRRLARIQDASVQVRSADELDAIVCTIGAHDFCQGSVLHPDEPQIARKEGWIWVRTPGKEEEVL
jgi:predicted RNase H-like nuclease